MNLQFQKVKYFVPKNQITFLDTSGLYCVLQKQQSSFKSCRNKKLILCDMNYVEILVLCSFYTNIRPLLGFCEARGLFQFMQKIPVSFILCKNVRLVLGSVKILCLVTCLRNQLLPVAGLTTCHGPTVAANRRSQKQGSSFICFSSYRYSVQSIAENIHFT